MRLHGDITQLGVTGYPISASFECVVRQHCERILDSAQFDASTRSRDFLRYIVDEALSSRTEKLTQNAIAMAVFGRKENFDAILDPIVRVQAGRLRRSLERYYLLAGNTDSVRIELPKGGYAPEFVTVAENNEGWDAVMKNITLTKVAHDWPAIVIFPFGISAPQTDEPLLQLKDELILELCRYRDVRVVRQHDMERLDLKQQASIRFELRGSMRRVGDDCVISARLVDRMTGVQVWGDEYHTSRKPDRWSGSIEDIARVIAANIGAEHGVIVRILAAEKSAKRAAAGGPFGTILRCHQFFISPCVRALNAAIEDLEYLVEREPEIPAAWTCLARLYLANHTYELSDKQTPIERAIGYAQRGVLLDPSGARVRCILAATLLAKGELPSARDELKQALRLNSDSLAYREVIGWLMTQAGDWDGGMALIRETMERNPLCLPHVKQGLWADHLCRGEFESAYVAALEYGDASFFWRELMIACCLGHLGRTNEARASTYELLQAKPEFPERGRKLIGNVIKSIELRECIVEGICKAGLTLR